jgi:anti-sigma regulatory factor (Ser/Thr protein kinase)
VPSQRFPAWARSVPDARRYVTDLLDVGVLGQVPPQLCQTAALLVSELATNAVRHAGAGDYTVAVEFFPAEGRLWIGVTDTGRGQPVVRTPSVTAEHGRGLQLVGLLSDRWGARRRRETNEKTVWFELHAPLRVPRP